jgi:O-antigen/teichoic acid export membrane protein
VVNPDKRRLARNITSNYLSVLWIGGLTLALIPWYTRQLDGAQWGLVAVCMSLQAVMTLLDTGLSQVMPRDVARVAHDCAARAKIFHLFARTYTVLAGLGFAVGQLGAPFIVEYWLQTEKSQIAEVTTALRVVLVQFLFQFVNNANTGYWNGTQEQGTANLRQCFFSTAKHAAALLLIMTWEASAMAYLVAFASISALECLSNRYSVHRRLANSGVLHLALADFKRLGREVSVLAVGVLIGMFLSQLDRILLSGAVDIASFGRYVVVSSLGLAFMQLQAPLVRAFLPKIASADTGLIRQGMKQLGAAILVMCVLPCAVAAVAAPWILDLWIGDARIVEQGTLPLRLILAAVALNSLYQVLYQQMLLKSMASVILKVNLLILVIITPAAAWAVNQHGIAGGGMTWLAVSALQLTLGYLFLKKFVS